MTQEEKQLLLQDLCTRLPYGVICHANEINIDGELIFVNKLYNIAALYYDNAIGKFESCSINDIKPYLRPMSSMTEEEGKELGDLFNKIDAPCWVDIEFGCVTFAGDNDFIDPEIAEVYTDWLNKKMFDYRGLIEKGLALEATDDMYK